MGFFDFFTGKKVATDSAIPTNPLHDAMYVARCQKFSTDPVQAGGIMMVGDSITAGAENFPDLFPGILNQGIPGDTTVDLRKRLNLIERFSPSKIFLLIGTNNLGALIATDTTVKKDYQAVTYKLMVDYVEILSYLKNTLPNTSVFVQSILPINSEMTNSVTVGRSNLPIIQLNEVLSNVNHIYEKFSYINLYSCFLENSGKYLDSIFTDDGLHPNESGYRLWSNILKSYL